MHRKVRQKRAICVMDACPWLVWLVWLVWLLGETVTWVKKHVETVRMNPLGLSFPKLTREPQAWVDLSVSLSIGHYWSECATEVVNLFHFPCLRFSLNGPWE